MTTPSPALPPREPAEDRAERGGLSRRGVVTGAAAVWAAPTITVIAQAPAFASSGALRVVAVSPTTSIPVPAYRTGPMQTFTVLVTDASGTGVPGQTVTFSLTGAAGDTTSATDWLSLSPTTPSTTAVATTGTDGQATIPLRYRPEIVPAIPTTLSLTATLNTTTDAAASASWHLSYRAARPGTAAPLGAFGLATGPLSTHSLAHRNGRGYGWGNGSDNRLGYGGPGNARTPTAILSTSSLAGKTVTLLASGSQASHSIALASDGTLHAWGTNANGQFGDGTTTQRAIPVRVPTAGTSLAGKTITALAAGSTHSLALDSDGALHAWGNNASGQLGDGTTTPRSVPARVPTTGTSLAGKTIAAIAAGSNHSLALATDGTVHAWGINTNGQLGDATTTTSTSPIAVKTSGTSLAGKTITAIASGGSHCVALASDGTLHAWGANNNNTLGDGTAQQRTTPVAVTIDGTSLAGKTITAIAAGSFHSLALASDGTVHAWGNSTNGQLGTGTNASSATPVAVATGTTLAGKTITAIIASGSSSLALASDGTLHAWGANNTGTLGDGTTASRPSPVAVTIIGTSLAGKTIAALATGGGHCVALASDGTLHAWGANTNGQLGDSTTTSRATATAVTTTGTSLAGKTITALATGSAHTFALASDGTLHAWGLNSSGQLGDSTTTSRATATAVTTTGTSLDGKTITAIASGSTHGLALASDGTLHTWGANASGQLGTGIGSQRASAVEVTTTGTSLAGKTITAIAAGSTHSLALASDGTLHTWGSNSNGQLGNGSTTARATAATVTTTSDTSLAGKTIVAIAAGNGHSLALASDGTLHAWGNNNNGQLGDSTTALRTTAVAVTTDGTSLDGKIITAIAAGFEHSLALASDGSLHAWGANGSGQLGDGTTAGRTTAVAVTGTSLAGKTITAFAAGNSHSVALASDGTLHAWGANGSGQLGDGTTSVRTSAGAVSSLPA